jgi:transcriptional regulator GlxA family with amidase domain
MRTRKRTKAKTIVIVALPGVQLLDVSGPLDVFAEANAQAGFEAYRLVVAGAKPGPTQSSSGVRLMPDWIIGRDEEEQIDTLLIAGRPNAADVPADPVVSNWLRRAGGGPGRKGEAMPAGRSALQELQRWAAANPAQKHDIASLAKRMNLSPRHFSRLFRAEIGMTPATWVEEVRVNAARRLLEQGRESPKQVAAHCGFADANTLRRAFARALGVTPTEYRKRFAGPLRNMRA